MMSSATPLRDRLHSNSPADPNAWQSPATTPLRIAKKESPQRGSGLSRRQSASYKHMKSNNLVTKSPFRSQIPTPLRPSSVAPSPRRVSGEKRSRPISMHEQAENEHPLGFKRRQSRAFQGLLEKEPVTKSPFKLMPGDEGYEPPPPLAPATTTPRKLRKKAPVYEENEELPPPLPPKHLVASRASPRPALSPARPSLVSKRLHGPRESGMFGRKARRKTVTFDERCDVMEFSAEEEQDVDENQTDWTTDTDDEDDAHAVQHDELEERPTPHDANESYDSSQANDDSITGLVDSMLQDNEPHTPTHHQPFPDGLETEGGIPYGRTHHAERAASAHELQRSEHDDGGINPLSNMHSGLSTPHSRDTPPLGPVSPGSHIPLGRSSHSERQRAYKEHENAGVDEDIHMLPPSPSPKKRTGVLPIVEHNRDSLIPRFDLGLTKDERHALHDLTSDGDPFEMPVHKDEPLEERSFMSAQLIEHSADGSLDPANLSVGHSEVSLSGLDMDELGSRAGTEERNLPATSTPPTSPPFRPSLSYLRKTGTQSMDNLIDLDSPPPPGAFGSLRSNSPRTGSPALGHSPRSGSPLFARDASPLLNTLAKSASQTNLHSPNGSLNGRSPRISREDVHRRLLKKRSIESPLRESVDFFSSRTSVEDPPQDERRSSSSRPLPRPLSRDNPTYDGVMSVDPEPQSIDPPRPSVAPRAHSSDAILPDAPAIETFKGLDVNFSTGFDVGDINVDGANGLGMSLGETPLGDMRSALDRLMEDVAGEASVGPSEQNGMRLKIEEVTAGIQAGQYQTPPHNMDTDAEQSREVSVHDDAEMADLPPAPAPRPLRPMSPAAPPPPVKDARRMREELILKKKREARQREEEEDLGLRTPPRNLGIGRPSRRRSRSTGDAGDPLGRKARQRLSNGGGLLDDVPVEDDALTDSIDRELRKLGSPGQRSKYHVRERRETIFASADDDRVSHVAGAGDIDSGKAWKTYKRPSDMNEYSTEIKRLRAKGGKAYGKVFVRVLETTRLDLPIPSQETFLTCTLFNGIHFVETPAYPLEPRCQLHSEFELIETSKLEITFTLKVQVDPHVEAQFRANAPPKRTPAPAPAPPPPASKGGVRSFFLGGKKAKPVPARATPPPPAAPPVHRLQENLARYLTVDGSLGRAFIKFSDIAHECDCKPHKMHLSLFGQKLEPGGSYRNIDLGGLTILIFRLPPIPGVPANDLPQSLDECDKGIRAAQFGDNTFMEGSLTQYGGDCSALRQRQFRLQGSNLIACQATKALTSIDLRKAVSVIDDEEMLSSPMSPASGSGRRYSDQFSTPFLHKLSFRILFSNGEEIIFGSDTEDQKALWVQALRAVLGYVPKVPLWAQILWAERKKAAERALNSP